MTFDGRTATTAVMLIIFLLACVFALSLPQKAAFMPLLVGIPGVLLCAAQLVVDLRRRPSADKVTEAKDTSDGGRSELEVFIWLGLFAVALIGFGFLIGGPLIVAAFVHFSSRETWQNALFAGAGTFAALYGIFIWLLEIRLFPGLILDKLF